jgi:hypothetical protein
MSYEEVEAAYIALFTNNYPHLPCPPYGSLFTAIDSEKRLEEMLAIKEFYQSHGMDIADSFDDLPDHLCVELEFMQLLCFREREAEEMPGPGTDLAGVRKAEAEFLDRFLLPFRDAPCRSGGRVCSRTIPIAIYLKPHDAFCCPPHRTRRAGGIDIGKPEELTMKSFYTYFHCLQAWQRLFAGSSLDAEHKDEGSGWRNEGEHGAANRPSRISSPPASRFRPRAARPSSSTTVRYATASTARATARARRFSSRKASTYPT